MVSNFRADLRERPTLYNWEYAAVKTQADYLPTFMKTAKKQGQNCQDVEGYAEKVENCLSFRTIPTLSN